MAAGLKLTIFLPRQLLKIQSEGLLLGCIVEKVNELSIHVLATCGRNVPEFPSCIGHVTCDSAGEKSLRTKGSTFWLSLLIGAGNKFKVQINNGDNRLDATDAVVIMYDPQELLTSEIISDEEYSGCEIFTSLMKSLRKFQELAPDEHVNLDSFLSEDKLEMKHSYCWRTGAVLAFLGLLFSFCGKVKNRFYVARKALVSSNLWRQMLTRGNQIEEIAKHCSNKGRLTTRFWNVMSALLVDVLLGISVILIVERTVSLSIILEWALEWTQTLVTNLRGLVVWLMDVPAGFKLNYPLNKALGTFFLFHIHLWEAYVYVIKPLAFYIFKLAVCCGIFGITFQLSLLQDLVAIATFHIYCFYAYAAKMYNLQIMGLVSMWRLFCGKKWNPLRMRVDSCSYDVEQLFLGTLVLTILLFLLPTTVMYYVVFTVLRIAVLSIQGAISVIVQTVNGLSPYAVILHVIGSKIVNANIVFMPGVNIDVNQPLHLEMKVTASSLTDTISQFQLPMQNQSGRQAWPELIKNLLFGQLVYPI